MANITTENINTLAQLASSIGDGDYIYIYKASSGTFARIEKSLLLQAAGGGGMSPAIYNAIKLNVNSIQATLDELLGKLANLALTADRPNQVGVLSWPAQDSGGDSGGDVTPVVTPTITLNPTSLTFINTEVGNSRTLTFFVTGNGLTSGILLNVSGDGFSCSPTSISAINANTSTEVTVTFEPSNAGNKIGLITVSSDGAESKALTLNGSASNADSQTTGVSVSKNTRNCIISDNTSNGVLADGLSYSGEITIDDTTTLIQKKDGSGVSRGGYPALIIPSSGVSVLVGGNAVQAYNNGSININSSSINGNIVISAIAESPVIVNRKISSGGAKYSGEAIGWCYNDVYIQLPNDATHIRWFHGAHSGGVGNAYFATVVMTATSFSAVQKVSATSSVDEQSITVNRGSYGSYRLYILASFAVSQLNSCYIKSYTSEEDAENDFNGTILFDGKYATQQQP